MKKVICFIAFALVYFCSVAQTFPQNPTNGQVQINNTNLGGGTFNRGVRGGVFVDTSAANDVLYMKGTKFMLISTTSDNNYWYRSADTMRWELIATTTSNCAGTQLISGSITWSGSGLVYDATDLDYYILCSRYFANSTTLTLSVADPTNPRIDKFYADNTGNIGVITGTPSANPQEPAINPLTQIDMGFVYIPAGSTVPAGTTQTVIYNENVEWSGTSNVPSVNFTYGTNPYIGSVSTYLPSAPNSSYVEWQSGGIDYLFSDAQYLKFWVRLNANFVSDPLSFLDVTFEYTDVTVSQTLSVGDGDYNMDYSLINQWQLVSIPLTGITTFGTEFNSVHFVINSAPTSFQLDYVYLLETATVPPVISSGWSLNLNTGTNPTTNGIGTSDSVGVAIKTNSQTRLIFPANGIVELSNDELDQQLLTIRNDTIYKTNIPTAYGTLPIVVEIRNDSTFITCPTCDTTGGGGGSGWGLTGNAGTTPGTNYLGTADNQPLEFRVNNIRSGLLNIANNQTYFGYQAGLSATGNSGSFFGAGAGKNNVGVSNSFFGANAGFGNTDVGGANAGFGVNALYETTGHSNVAVGNGAGFQTVYNGTISLGSSASPIASNQFAVAPNITEIYFPGMSTGAGYVLKDVSGNGRLTLQPSTSTTPTLQQVITAGATLTGANTIAAQSFAQKITGTNANIFTVQATNGTGTPVSSLALGGTAIYAENTSSTNPPVLFRNAGGSSGNIQNMMTLQRIAFPSPNGTGASINFNMLDNDAGDEHISGRIANVWTDALTGISETRVYGMNAMASVHNITFFGTGEVQFKQYGSGSYTGTPTYSLSVDANGKIIETPYSSGGGTGDVSFSDTSSIIATKSDLQLVQGTGGVGSITTKFGGNIASGAYSVVIGGSGNNNAGNTVFMMAEGGVSLSNTEAGAMFGYNPYAENTTDFFMFGTTPVAINASGSLTGGINANSYDGEGIVSIGYAPTGTGNGAVAISGIANNPHSAAISRGVTNADSSFAIMGGTANYPNSMAIGAGIVSTVRNTVFIDSLRVKNSINHGEWKASPIANAYIANPNVTVNGQLINLGGSGTVAAAAGTLTGSTLASGVTSSSLTSFGSSIALGTPASGNFSSGTFTWPTFNQNTTGSAASLTTGRKINGVSFNGTADITVDKRLLAYQALGSTIVAENVDGQLAQVINSLAMTSQRAYFQAVYIDKDQTITGFKWKQATAGSYTANNYNGGALYSYSGGTLTLVASSTNDGNIWTATSGTIGSKAFSSPYSATAGLYFVAIIWSASATTTAPSLGTLTATSSINTVTDFTNSAKTSGLISSLTALPSPTQAISGITASANEFWIGLY